MRVHRCLHEHAIDRVSVHQYGLATMRTRAVNAVWYLIACAAQISVCAVLVNITREERQNRKTVQTSGSVR